MNRVSFETIIHDFLAKTKDIPASQLLILDQNTLNSSAVVDSFKESTQAD